MQEYQSPTVSPPSDDKNSLRLYVCGLFFYDSLRTHVSDDLIETPAFCSAVTYLGSMISPRQRVTVDSGFIRETTRSQK